SRPARVQPEDRPVPASAARRRRIARTRTRTTAPRPAGPTAAGSWTGGASLTPGRADARGSIMRWSGRCRLVAVASTPLQPGRRIHRLATAAQLEIERRPPVSAGTADPGDGVAAAHPLPGIAQQGVV